MKSTNLLLSIFLLILTSCSTYQSKEGIVKYSVSTGCIDTIATYGEKCTRFLWFKPKCVPDTTYKYIDKCTDTTTPPPPPDNVGTEFGIMQAGASDAELMRMASTGGISIVRIPYIFSNDRFNSKIDDFLQAGYRIQINFNYLPTYSPVPFPSDTNMIREKAIAFFEHYLSYRKRIPFVVVENEWDNLNYRDWKNTSIDAYLKELEIVVREGHRYGFKIADAGITGNSLQRWTYTKLTGEDAKWWKTNYFVGLNSVESPFNEMVALVDYYASKVKDIPIDYLNMHWYNARNCLKGYNTAVNKYIEACGKWEAVNNEFGIKTLTKSVFECTIEEMITSGMKYAIIYSGDNGDRNAIKVTDDMLQSLPN